MDHAAPAAGGQEEINGEAQQQQLQLQQMMELVQKTKDKPLSVASITIFDLKRTRPRIIQNELLRRAELWQPSTVAGIHYGLTEVAQALENLEVFDRVAFRIEPSKEGPGFCDVELRVREKKPLHITAGTYVNSNEGSAELQATVRNRLGFAESVQIAGERGMRGSDQFSLSIRKPRPGAKPVTLEVRISQLHRSFQEASSFTERARGASLRLSTQDLRHSVAYEAGWRTVRDPTRAASPAVAAHLGHSLKSALQYSFRHLLAFPVGGDQEGELNFKATSEVAGLALGSGVPRFLRQHLQGYLAVPLPETSAFVSLAADAGMVVPVGRGARGRPSSIADRFFLGGPASLRGFSANSAGPCDLRHPRSPSPGQGGSNGSSGAEGATAAAGTRPRKVDYLGGDLYASLTAALHFPLPWQGVNEVGIRGHAFLNAGNTALLAGSRQPLRECA
eukprot:CAMPEP_0206145992 /NCGR_PEP_ID=MMETSP1473-20131121/29170_1 /ASSEMBLY_ACC=CAM_ASM_001109 /TAXON_ID=1461547 /ORGANISM="Stichococcus sp, Strain RCC1054" /LENGTH=448 /DNA_ID=CAMNT_0053542405 /DNA_START=138 /DNA_END=1481 /DNA_ORIENTATION=-